jgi:hypothetical protein
MSIPRKRALSAGQEGEGREKAITHFIIVHFDLRETAIGVCVLFKFMNVQNFSCWHRIVFFLLAPKKTNMQYYRSTQALR